MKKRQRMPKTPKGIENAGVLIICSALVIAPLALGGGLVSVNLLLATLLTSGLLLLNYQSFQAPVGHHWSGIERVLFALFIFTTFQLLPLPHSILEILSPHALDIWQLSGADAQSWNSISTTPNQTLAEILKLLNFFLLAYLTQHFVQRRKSKQTVMLTIIGTGAVITVIALLQNRLGFSHPFNQAGRFPEIFPTTFNNSNHAGAFLGTTALLGLCFSLHATTRIKKISIVLTIACTCGVFLSMSRGAILSLFICFVFFGIVSIKIESAKFSGSDRLKIFFSAGIVATVVGLLAFDDLLAEMMTMRTAISPEKISKFLVWQSAPDILEAYPWTGVGKGSFQTNFTRFMTVDNSATWTYLENGWIQVLVDWGLIVGSLVLLSFSMLWLKGLLNVRKRPKTLGALSALLFLALHNNVDFNLEITSLGFVAIVCFIALGNGSSRKNTVPSFLLFKHQVWLTALSCVVIALSAQFALGTGLNAETQNLRRIMGQKTQSWDDRTAAANSIVKNYPADYYLHQVVADQALREKNYPDALRWINKAMYLNPKAPDVHITAARTFHKLGYQKQALLEYKLAVQALPHRAAKIAEEMLRKGASPQYILALENQGAEPILIGRVLLDNGYAKEVLELNQAQTTNATELRALAQERLGLHNEAYETAKELEGIDPTRPTAYRIQMDALMALGKCEESLAVNKRSFNAITNINWLHTQKTSALVACKRFEEAVIHGKQTLWAGKTPAEKAASHFHLGNAYTGLQQHQYAQEAYGKAAQQDSRGYYWQAWIASLEKLGQKTKARQLLLESPGTIRQSAWVKKWLDASSNR